MNGQTLQQQQQHQQQQQVYIMLRKFITERMFVFLLPNQPLCNVLYRMYTMPQSTQFVLTSQAQGGSGEEEKGEEEEEEGRDDYYF